MSYKKAQKAQELIVAEIAIGKVCFARGNNN